LFFIEINHHSFLLRFSDFEFFDHTATNRDISRIERLYEASSLHANVSEEDRSKWVRKNWRRAEIERCAGQVVGNGYDQDYRSTLPRSAPAMAPANYFGHQPRPTIVVNNRKADELALEALEALRNGPRELFTHQFKMVEVGRTAKDDPLGQRCVLIPASRDSLLVALPESADFVKRVKHAKKDQHIDVDTWLQPRIATHILHYGADRWGFRHLKAIVQNARLPCRRSHPCHARIRCGILSILLRK
jgi:hypothetical protein